MTTEKEQLEAEIAKRDARIAELEAIVPIESELRAKAEQATTELERELAALKAQQPSVGVVVGALVSALEGIVHDERVPNEVSQDYAALLIEARSLNPCRAQAVACVACEGRPMGVNNPCAVCGGAQAVRGGWRMVKVGSEGVRFGNAWISHERITGYTAEQLNSGDCRVTGRAYMEWLAAPPTTADAVPVPAAMPERWEDRLSRMHQTIQAGCWPKRWVDDAKDYELGELRALIARQEVNS